MLFCRRSAVYLKSCFSKDATPDIHNKGSKIYKKSKTIYIKLAQLYLEMAYKQCLKMTTKLVKAHVTYMFNAPLRAVSSPDQNPIDDP